MAIKSELEAKSKAVSISQLKPGMLLARDVKGKNALMLLSAGFILNKRTIERLNELKTVIVNDSFYVEP